MLTCALSRPDGKLNPPVLFVDGYNVIGYWPKLKKYFQAGDLDTARERLLSELGQYLHYKGAPIPRVCATELPRSVPLPARCATRLPPQSHSSSAVHPHDPCSGRPHHRPHHIRISSSI